MIHWLKNKLAAIRSMRHLIHWQQYRVLFGTHILRYFVVWFSIVPVLAFMFKRIPDKLRIPVGFDQVALQKFVEVSLGLPFNWAQLWVASVCYTVALLIYQFCCPQFIKRYNNYTEYSAQGHSPRWIAWVAHHAMVWTGYKSQLFDRMEKKAYLVPSTDPADEGLLKGLDTNVVIERDFSKLLVRRGKEIFVFSMPIPNATAPDREQTRDVENDLFWEVFAYYASSRLFVRLVILFLLSVALWLFLVVLFHHVLSAIPYAAKEWPWLCSTIELLKSIEECKPKSP